MQYIAYRIGDGDSNFVAGASSIDELISTLNKKEGVPRKPCKIMNLENHRHYKS